MKQKKILFLALFTIISLFVLSPNVYADVTCSAIPNAVIDDSIVDIVHIVIQIIHIAVPILLVIFGMIDLVKGIMAQKEDEIKKGQQTFVKRVIAAIIVFFVIAVVKFVISTVAGSNSNDVINCFDCFIQGSSSSSCTRVSSTPGASLDDTADDTLNS